MLKLENLGAPFDPELGGDNLALIDCLDWEHPREYTHRELDDLANGYARGLLKNGLKRGDAVAILSANRAEFLIAYLGILRAGMVAVPASHKFSPEVLAFIFEDSRIRHIFCDGPTRNRFQTDLPVTNFDDPGAESPARLLDAGPFETVLPDVEEVAMVLYTSGTTGRPKGVPLTHHGHVWAMKERTARGWPFTAHRLLIAAPLYHMNALCTALFGLSASTSTVLMPEFEARRYLEAIARYRCTWITSVPTMLALATMEDDLIDKLDLSSVKLVRMGSAPISPKLWAKVKAAFPGASVGNGYGTTESGPIVFGSPEGRPVPDLSVGWQMPGVDLKLIDAAGQEADEGELWHRTPATTRGYLNLPEKSAEVLTPDGWHKSGDIFRRDEQGCYYFVGRADDMFVCGGENIHPGEAEAVLVGHPGIDQSCVVPVPDDIKGQLPVAFVVLKAGSALTPEAVKQYALEKAPAFMHPRMVVMMDELPLAGPGKVDRKGLQKTAIERWQKTEGKLRRTI